MAALQHPAASLNDALTHLGDAILELSDAEKALLARDDDGTANEVLRLIDRAMQLETEIEKISARLNQHVPDADDIGDAKFHELHEEGLI